MNQRWHKFIDVSPGIWAIRAIITISILGLIIIKIIQYVAIPTIRAKNINLRATPSINAKVIQTIPTNTKYQIVKKNETTNWWKVEVAGKTGWVASWLLDDSKYNAKTASNLPEATIVLDPGHGGEDSGTLTHMGESTKDMEKTYTLPLAMKVRQLLKANSPQVIMTRSSDKTVSLNQRATISNQSKANLYISFHYNSSPTINDGTGFGIYKYYDTASAFANQLDTEFGNLPLKDRGINFGNFYVLRNNQRPSVLIEMGFMDNTKDLKYIRNTQYKDKVAKDIVLAMQKYFRK